MYALLLENFLIWSEFKFIFLFCLTQVLDNLPHDLVYRETPSSAWLETWVTQSHSRFGQVSILNQYFNSHLLITRDQKWLTGMIWILQKYLYGRAAAS